MQDMLTTTTSAVASLSAFFSFCEPRFLRHTNDATDTSKAACFFLMALAGSCGVLVGWHGRGWHACYHGVYSIRREGRRRNPLWLLPAPSVSTAASLPNWVAACMGQRWVPRLVWSPPLLRQCSVTCPVDSTAKRRASERARLDKARWGTRLLNRPHSRHHLTSTSEVCAPSYAVNVFHVVGDTSSATAPSRFPSLGAPLRVLPRHTFALLYDPNTRFSLWCGYHLTRSGVDRARQQRRCQAAYADRSLEKSARRVPAEVQRRGYDRGHLAPHASVACTPQCAMEAALLTNIHLQHRSINRGVWRWLEAATRAYVRIPYSYDPSAGVEDDPSPAVRVRNDGWMLARLLAQRTAFASRKDTQRVAQRLSRRRGAVDGRHLCVNVGPLYYASPASSSRSSEFSLRVLNDDVNKCVGGARGVAQSNGVHQRLPTRMPSLASGCSAEGRSNDCGPSEGETATTHRKSTAAIPDAFFLSLWDALTHHHLHLVIPNTPDTPEMQTLTQALAAAARHGQQQQQRPRRRGHHQTCTRVKRTSVALASPVMPAEDHYMAVEVALAAFMVPTERIEQLFAESLVEVRMRWAASQPGRVLSRDAASDSGPGVRSARTLWRSNVRPSPPTLALRAPLRFFPVLHEQWVWRTRWQRLAHRVLPSVLRPRRKHELVSMRYAVFGGERLSRPAGVVGH